MESIPKKNTPILIVDDDAGLLNSIRAMLVSSGMPEPALVSDARRALPLIREYPFQLVLIDLIMPHIKGMELLKDIKKEFPSIECVVITAVDDVSSAVQAMKFGAYDYLVKPLKKDRLIITINNALEKYSIRHSVDVLERSPKFSDIVNLEAFKDMVAGDELMALVFCQAETFASSEYNLLLTGETGTGKELLAGIVHRLSHRSNGPFIALNMGAFSKALLEDELFGHAKGAFTGATYARKGFFEEAMGGTLFLDEISEMDQDLQGKLLRVIQERELYRLGSTDKRGLDVRIITATNKDLREEVKQGRFRKDLYYRLNVCHIDIPPLRNRRLDILPLAMYFLEVHSKKNNKQIYSLSKELADFLENYSFPGNVRELENIIVTCVLNENTDELMLSAAGSLIDFSESSINAPLKIGLIKEAERKQICFALGRYIGNRTKAADMLGISLRTLQRKMKEYEIS